MAEPFDITTLGAVKTRAEVDANNSKDDQEISDAISAFSLYVMNRTGISSFANVATVTETRDGNGNDQMYVRTPPIVNVVSLTICQTSIPLAGPWPAFGYYIADDQRSIKIRGTLQSSSYPWASRYRQSGLHRSNGGFARGQGNVLLVYNGGYAGVPFDLEYAVRSIVAINYKRKAWQDMKSRIVDGGNAGKATTIYRDWAWPPEYEKVIEFYARRAIIG